MPPSRKRRILTAVIILAALIILPVTVIFPCVVRNIEVPKRQQLTAIDSSEIHFTTTFPPGSHFNFVLGVPRAKPLPPTFQGRLIVSEGARQIIDCPIGSDDMEECNWLHSPDLQGYILTWRKDPKPSIQELTFGRHTYEFAIRFSLPPPEGSSLWISWLQRGRD